MATQRERTDDERYATVLRVAGDITSLDTAFDAELLVSTLLGSVYSIAQGDRAASVRGFAEGLRAHVSRDTTDEAVAVRSVLDGWSGRAPAGGPAAPEWSSQVAQVSPVAAYAYGDVYGDQVTYVATFRYPDERLGGPEHALVALVDHNLGFLRDLFVTPAAGAVLARLQPAVAADPLTWLTTVDPARLRSEVCRHLALTDALRDLPSDDSLATDRALALARLELLPAVAGGVNVSVATISEPPASRSTADGADSTDDHPGLVAEFMASRYAARLRSGRGRAGESVRYCLELIGQFAAGYPEADALRWSPAVVDLFLLDWVPRRALLDAEDINRLPTVLTSWVTWAGQRRGLPAHAVARTVASIAQLRPKFAELSANGSHRSPEAAAVARMLAEGVDPADESAVAAWLEQQAGAAP